MFSYNILCNELNRYHHNFPTCWPMKVVHLTLYYPFPIFSIHNIPDNTLSTPMQFAFRLRTRGNNSPSLFCLLARFLSSAPKQIYKLLTTRNQASRRILFRIVGINTFNPTQKRPTPATGVSTPMKFKSARTPNIMSPPPVVEALKCFAVHPAGNPSDLAVANGSSIIS